MSCECCDEQSHHNIIIIALESKSIVHGALCRHEVNVHLTFSICFWASCIHFFPAVLSDCWQKIDLQTERMKKGISANTHTIYQSSIFSRSMHTWATFDLFREIRTCLSSFLYSRSKLTFVFKTISARRQLAEISQYPKHKVTMKIFSLVFILKSLNSDITETSHWLVNWDD